MCEHCINSYIGKGKDIVIKSGEVDVVNSSKDLLFDIFLDCCGSGKFIECGFVEACSFRSGSSIGAGGMLGYRALVHRELEIDSSNSCIFGIGHDKPQMTMAVATMGGRDCTCIGVNLFGEKFHGGVGRHSINLGEHQMWEREWCDGCCHCLGCQQQRHKGGVAGVAA